MCPALRLSHATALRRAPPYRAHAAVPLRRYGRHAEVIAQTREQLQRLEKQARRRAARAARSALNAEGRMDFLVFLLDFYGFGHCAPPRATVRINI